jgi:hypothetical protein
MYICYVDESGHCGERADPSQPVEVLCGVLTSLVKLSKTQREHAALLKDLEFSAAELKASDAYRGRREWAALTHKQRDRLFERVFSWAEERDCRFIVSPIDAHRFFHEKNSGSELCQRLQFPYEAGAFSILLAIQRLHASKRYNKGRTIVVFDEQPRHDTRLLTLLEHDLSFTRAYCNTKTGTKKKRPPLDQIIDVPHFSKSHLAVVIQIADWAAFVVNAYLRLAIYGEPERYGGERGKLASWYQRIQARMVSRPAVQPPGDDPLCELYREKIRPPGWSGGTLPG